jgi:hypothetical protein
MEVTFFFDIRSLQLGTPLARCWVSAARRNRGAELRTGARCCGAAESHHRHARTRPKSERPISEQRSEESAYGDEKEIHEALVVAL